MLAGIGLALLGTGAIPAIAHADDVPAASVSSGAGETPVEEPATMWDKTREVSGDTWEATKEGSARAWDKTKEVSGDAWDATKEGSARAWDKTKEVSGDAWDATKEGSAKAWEKTKEVSGDAWDKTRGMVQGEEQAAQESEPAAEAGAHQETPATTGESP